MRTLSYRQRAVRLRTGRQVLTALMPWGLSMLGLVILLLAGDSLVKGAVNLSLRLGVPALIVSQIGRAHV